MDWSTIIAVILGVVGSAYGLFELFLKTYVKTTVEESVKNGFEVARQKMREGFEREMQTNELGIRLRLAAIDDRLKAHQEAYAIWRKMRSTLHAQDVDKAPVLKECSAFWDQKCLYLSNDARASFWKAMNSFADYAIYKASHRSAVAGGIKVDIEDARNSLYGAFSDFTALGSALERAVDLEAIQTEKVTNGREVITAEGVSNAE